MPDTFCPLSDIPPLGYERSPPREITAPRRGRCASGGSWLTVPAFPCGPRSLPVAASGGTADAVSRERHFRCPQGSSSTQPSVASAARLVTGARDFGSSTGCHKNGAANFSARHRSAAVFRRLSARSLPCQGRPPGPLHAASLTNRWALHRRLDAGRPQRSNR
jgi:hypothetical protein